jgi:hypothetical protein
LPLKGGRPLSEGNHVFFLPYASRLSTFEALGWGVSAVFSPRRWRNATPWELVPFSHRSPSRIFIMQPGCTPPPAVTQDGDLQLDSGGKRAGLRPLPLPQPQGFSSLRLGRGVCRVGVAPCVGGGPLLHSVMGGGERLSSVALAAAACPAFGREWLRSRSRRRRLPRQLEDVLPLLRRPSPMEWGCSYLRRGNRSSVCDGTLNASVFVHCGCRGLNIYVISARSRVFSSFSSTESRLLII